MPAGTRARSVPTETSLPQQVAQDGSSCVIKNPLHTRVITFFKDKNYNYFFTSRFNAEHIFTAIDDENFTEDSSKRLTTKILQVRHSQRKFLSKVRVTHTEGNPAQGPLIIQRGKFRYKVRAALLFDGNPATGPTNTVQRRKHLLQFATNSVLLQLYPIHIFTSQIYEYDKGSSYSGGASSQRRIILQALTRLNFFDFQKFENFNDFSIVIDNSPESNGYKFLSMTRKF